MRWQTRAGLLAGGAGLGACIGLIAVLESSYGSYHKSPLRLIDPSCAQGDVALCDALELSLSGGVPALRRQGRSFYDVALPIEPLSGQEFRSRVEAVPGWDSLVVYPPYQIGARLPDDPSITSWWLKRQIRHTDGLPQDGYWYVLVVRDQAVVGSLFLETELEGGGVVNRGQ